MSDDRTHADFMNPSQANTKRSLIFMTAGAVIGLAIAGFGLFTAQGTATRTVPPEDVALVNQKPILMSDFVNQVQNEFTIPFAEATAEQKRKALNDMIGEELKVQHGQALDLPNTDVDVRAALVASVEGELAASVLAQIPTQEQLKAYYEAHKAKYRTEGLLAAQDLLLALDGKQPAEQAMVRAANAVQDLRQGASVAAVSSRYGLKATGKVNGEELDFAAKIHLGDKLFAAVENLTAGQVSDPIQGNDGVHVVVVTTRQSSVQLDFEAASNVVFNDLKKEALDKVLAGGMDYLRRQAEILVAPEYAQ